MARSRSPDLTITSSMVRGRNIIYYILLLANFIYLFVLYMISINPPTTTPPKTNGLSLDFMFYLLVIVAVIVLIINQRILIPRADKIEEPYNRFPIHLIVLILGVDATSIYGVMLGFISLEQTNSINWIYVGIFIVWSFIYGVYFYLVHYHPTVAEIEIGKTIPRRNVQNKSS